MTICSEFRRGTARILIEVSSVLAVVFLAINAHPYEVPEPLWTPADLPTVADESANGWTVAAAKYEGEIPDDLEPLVEPSDHDVEQFWQRVEQRRHRLHAFLAGDVAREANARIDEARRRPSFVDDCVPHECCFSLDWRQLHRIAVLRSIDLANSGDLDASFELLQDLIRMDVAHLESARTLISFFVATANLQEALDRADMIVARFGTDSPVLVELVRGVDIERIDLRNVVVGEYLTLVENLDALAREEPAWSLGLYSHALTLRGVNERFERRHRQATRHDAFAALGGGESSPKREFGWWFRNPVGKMVLDRTTVNPQPWVDSIEEDLRELGRTRALLLDRLAHRHSS